MFGVIVCFGKTGESGEPTVREETEAIRDRRSVAAEERSDSVREMAESCPNPEEAPYPQAEAQGPSGIEPVHQDPRQEPRYRHSHSLIHSLLLFLYTMKCQFMFRISDWFPFL